MTITPFTRTLLTVQRVFNFYDPLSCGSHRKFASSYHYPVFIIGAPRSGSTLLYQLLLKQGRFSYISNLMALMPGFMIVLARIFKNLHKLDKIKYSSYGYIPGIFSPSEAGAIFEKWFDSDPPEEAIKRIRNTIIQISRCFNAPLLSKNLKNSLRLSNIYKIIPEARFIYVTRDPIFNAQSILLARRKLFGNDSVWWSVAPDGYEIILDKDPLYQVIWQVFEINKQIKRFLEAYSADYIEISYEALCENPELEVNNITDSMECSVAEKTFDSAKIMNQNQIKLNLSELQNLKFFYKHM